MINGTTGQPAVNQKVELLTLGEGMNATRETFTGTGGRFTFEQVELAPSSPHILLRTIYRGVNYNQSLSSTDELADPQLLTIYETAPQLADVGVSMPFMVALAHGNELRIEHQYLLTNDSQPKRTLANSLSTFEFDTPDSPSRSEGVGAGPGANSSASAAPYPGRWRLPDQLPHEAGNQ